MSEKRMFVVLLGPPGVGKGTQAERLADRLGLPHVSSGELFRENIEDRTPLGLEAKGYIDRGTLVPDEVTIGMVADRLQSEDCLKGAILDGFPRTIHQAEALDRILAQSGSRISLVPYIKAAKETLLQRLGGRWTCKDCQEVYHLLHRPPRVCGRCDVCGGTLYQRDDDTPETHRKRIDVYEKQTAPLIEFYRGRELLVEVDGEQGIDEVFGDLVAQIGRRSNL
jgi:adenylate kinase